MKRTYIIILSILAILLLGVRAIYLMVHRNDNEREWFWKHLKYDFGSPVDSVKSYGNKNQVSFIYFHKVHGQFDPAMDDRLDGQMKHGSAHFIRGQGERYWFFTRIDSINEGDSVAVNSDKNSLIIYRKGRQFRTGKVENSVRSEPFR